MATCGLWVLLVLLLHSTAWANLCTNTCGKAANGNCNDGGPGSQNSKCAYLKVWDRLCRLRSTTAGTRTIASAAVAAWPCPATAAASAASRRLP